MFVGLGYDRTDQTAMRALTATGRTAMFRWTDADLTRINSVGFRCASNQQERQLEMLAYLFELTYDLMLSNRDNVSRSPGFETCIGVFGGK